MSSRPAEFRVLGVDASLTATGLALVTMCRGCADHRGLTPIDAEFVTVITKPDTSNAFTPGEDMSRRLRWLHTELTRIVQGDNFEAIGVEAVAFIPGKMRWSVISALGRARQVVDDVGSVARVAVHEVPAAEVARTAVDGRPGKASKADRVAALSAQFDFFAHALGDVKPAHHEHCADAFAAALAVARRIR